MTDSDYSREHAVAALRAVSPAVAGWRRCPQPHGDEDPSPRQVCRGTRERNCSRPNSEATAMRSRDFWRYSVFCAAVLAGVANTKAGSLTYSHDASALPGALGPAITLASITGTNDGASYTFTLKFFNPTIEGPSSNNSDAVYGFINLDTDKNAATGVTGSFLNSHSYESGFGQFSPSSLGIDAFISLSSEGFPFVHPGPGFVDLVTTNGFSTVDVAAVSYLSASGANQSTLSISIPVAVFSNAQLNLLDTGNFSAVVGNSNNATDFLGPAATTVPEPGSFLLLILGISLPFLFVSRQHWRPKIEAKFAQADTTESFVS